MPTTSLSSPEDVVNAALVQIGFKKQVGSLYDGSMHSVLALQIFGQTRDDMLRGGNWGFARRDASLTLQKQAPVGGYVPGFTTWTRAAYPPQAWLYQYGYPDDCLQVGIVKPGLIFVPNFDPGPNPWAIDNDNTYTPGRKVILSNVGPDALITYIGRVTDPKLWDANFAEALVDQLGKKLAPALTGLEPAQMSAIMGEKDAATAKMEQG